MLSRNRPKYRLATRKARAPRSWPWLLVGIPLGVVGWFGWQAAQPWLEKSVGSSPTNTVIQSQTPRLRIVVNQQAGAKDQAPESPAPPTNRTVPTTGSNATNRLALRPIISTNSDAASFPREPQTLFELQVTLARQGLSPGSLDGVFGSQTRAALRAFQEKEHLPVTSEPDEDSLSRLRLDQPPLTQRQITAEDFAHLQPLASTWLGKSQQSALAYETILEMLAEEGQSHPALVRTLNPGIDWHAITPGLVVRIPAVACSVAPAKAATLTIYLHERRLRAFDSQGALLIHFPCSIAQRVDKRPIGLLHIEAIIPNPNYTFDPAVFPESAEGRQINRKLVLAPGPNNPVGVAWIGLDKPGYGIHGTPHPEQVGRTESHGCFRLANWNAARLLQMAWVGMPVNIEP